MIGIDTNVLVRLLVRDNDAQVRTAERFITIHCSAEDPAFVSRVVIAEVALVLADHYEYDRSQIAAALRGLQNVSELELDAAEDVESALPPYQGGTKGGVRDTPQGNNYNNKTTISLLTPLRLRFDGHITDKIEFHVLIRNLLRRISSLSYFHCGEKFQVDFKGLIEKARTIGQIKSDTLWFDWKRYSTRQEEWMSLGGVTGTVSYEGDLAEFMPLLKLGEYVHVGKGTSFGLGKYEIHKRYLPQRHRGHGGKRQDEKLWKWRMARTNVCVRV